MEYIREVFTQNLQRLRKEARLTQLAMAQKIQVTQASYNRWETGTSWPSPEEIEKIANFYNVKSTNLFSDQEYVSTKITANEIIFDLEKIIEKIKNS